MDAQDEEGMTALHWAASEGHFDCVKLLVTDYNANTNTCEHHAERFTALDFAHANSHTDIVLWLREHSALSVEEIKRLAAQHIYAWWKGYQARISLVGLWREFEARKEAAANPSPKPERVTSPPPIPETRTVPSTIKHSKQAVKPIIPVASPISSPEPKFNLVSRAEQLYNVVEQPPPRNNSATSADRVQSTDGTRKFVISQLQMPDEPSSLELV